VEAEEIGYAGHGPFSKRAKAAQPAPPPQQVVDPSAFTAFRFCAFVWDRAGFSAGQIVFGGKPESFDAPSSFEAESVPCFLWGNWRVALRNVTRLIQALTALGL
jgi:hypothetical protein